MKLNINILIFLLLGFVAGNAQTALNTSFEAVQGYVAGNLNTQNNWAVTSGSATVSTAKFKTGTQAAALTATNAALKVDHVAYGTSVPGITGEVYVDMWVNPISIVTKNFAINGYDLFGSSSKRIFVVEFTTDNKIRAFNGSSSSSTNIATWASGQWVRVSVKIDFATEKYQVAINGSLYATALSFRETYTPTASGTRVATVKEYHSLRFNHLTDTDLSTTDVTVDDIYAGTTAIADVSFGASSTDRTITVTQPAFGTIALSPSKTSYQINDNVTATLTLPAGYKNNGWSGDLSGTELVKNFTVTGNMNISANTGIDSANPPAQYTITVNQPLNGAIVLSPASAGNVYYKETVVTATITNDACYQFNNWTGGLSGNQTTKTFTVTGAMTIGASVTANVSASVKRIVSNVTEFKSALAAMNPGDTVEVNNGNYDMSYSIARSGCENKPILITAKNIGMAVLNGTSAFGMKNLKYVTLRGFTIKSANIGTGIKMENCSKCRITQNSFNITENASCTWLYVGDTYASTEPLKSGYNRIDHNIFDGKTEAGNYIRIDGNINQISQYDTIDHNFFKNNGPRAENEKESIRVGVSTLSKSSAFITIEYNMFQDCDGDPEIVSIKSCDNTVRFNTFKNCLGVLCLRQGFRSTVEGNYFFSDGKTAEFNGGTLGCGGLRLYAKDHKIYNNYFQGLTGQKWDAAITLTNGDVTNSSSSTSDHYLPENLAIAFNTLYNNKSNIEVGFDNNGKYPLSPINNLLENNIVVDSTAPIVKSYSSKSLAGISFSNNIMYPTGLSSIGITATVSQIKTVDPLLVRPTCVDAGVPCTSMTASKVFRLSAASPAIDAAIGSYSYVNRDFEMYARPAAKDIGAHEYRGSSTIAFSALDSVNVGPFGTDISYQYVYGTLPVKLLDFNAVYANKTVQLNWQVAEEINVKEYQVQWSSTGIDFSTVAIVAAKANASYTAQHTTPADGNNYYRLKIIDADGKLSYSPVKLVNTDEASTTAVAVYPNPAKGFVTVTTGNFQPIVTAFYLYNATGKLVLKSSGTVVNKYILSLGNQPSGMYQLLVVQPGKKTITHSVNIIQ